jgi:hypothetical protein
VFDAKGCSLIIFGGWANRWLGDTLKLNVSTIIGPPYAITGISPAIGPVFGSTEVSMPRAVAALAPVPPARCWRGCEPGWARLS